ncbi:MAG TPA: hypothetical protein VEA40_00445 [Ramlibacter sp.]|nr:hypothetical protein [Ramlibacter sp.]
MRVFEAISWVVTLLLGVFAGLRLLNLWLSSGMSAPQYAAEAAGILAMTVLPYVFSRGVQQLRLLLREPVAREAAAKAAPAQAA